jgi:hypothetical protein
MLARLDGSCFQHPTEAIIGQHRQINGFLRTIKTGVTYDYVDGLPPLCTIIYAEFQLHISMNFPQSYKKSYRLHSFSRKKD